MPERKAVPLPPRRCEKLPTLAVSSGERRFLTGIEVPVDEGEVRSG
jgi:hypothetical protein